MANRKKVKARYISILLIAALIATIAAFNWPSGSADSNKEYAEAEGVSGTNADAASLETDSEPYYYDQLRMWQKQGVTKAASEIVISAKQVARKSDDAKVDVGSYGGANDVLLWSVPKGWVEYEVQVPEAGLYEIAVDYYPYAASDGGSRQPVKMNARINGEFPFREARSMSLEREFRDVQPVKYDAAGNELRSQIEEIAGWKRKALRDSEGAYSLPLQWHLRKGMNVIRIEALLQPVAIQSFTLKPPTELPSYSSVKGTYPANARIQGDVIAIEAERLSIKNSTAIQNLYDRDPLTTPHSLKAVQYNVLGGMRWMKGGQAATWDFEVPEDGIYQIVTRVKQNARQNLAVFRTVYIDGQIPFQEMENYKIPYDSDWQRLVLSDDEDEPYGFYLSKGKHSLTMEASYAPYMPFITRMDRVSREMRSVLYELRMVTGNREDKYRVWNVEKDIPGMTDRLGSIHREIVGMIDEMKRINALQDDIAHALENRAQDLAELLAEPDDIPNSITRLASAQEDLESRRSMLADSPLAIDRLYIAPVNSEAPRLTANFLEKTQGVLDALTYSFTVGNQLEDSSEDALNVWMIYGRDYVDELQQLANERFTPETGIKVNINLIPSSDMLTLANAAGMMPDVALGVPSNAPFDMALRNAALDLSKLPGADSLFAQYHPGTLLPFYYDGGYYGLPETINFKVLFYRKDILKQLGLDVPNTWDDVYRMLPTLLQNQYNFYVDPGDFTPFFFQNGVELYTQDGLGTGLDSPEAFRSYKQWTDFYNRHGLDRVVQSFYNQFRRGEMPIGIADFNMYMQLLVAAPELTNEWGIAPVPGTLRQDGTVVRWAGGSNPQNSMLFKAGSPDRQEKAWKFLQWFASTETQTEYGLNLEQFYGETFRWNSANVRAFANMPWKQDDLRIILEQWKWTKEIPNVPGGYMTGRELGFAWNRTTVDGENYRISLEKAIKEIKRELVRKAQEFKFVDASGKKLRSLNLPQVTEPWKGVENIAE